MTATLEAPLHPQAGADPHVPPQDLPAEQAVLGGMMQSKDAVADAVEVLTADDFYRPAHATIFRAITELFTRGEPADAITVAAALGDAVLARVGGAPFLHTCISEIPTVASTSYYAQIVAERATLRRLIAACTRGLQLAHRAAADGRGAAVTDVVDLAQQALYEVTDQRDGDGPSVLADLFQPTLDQIEAAGTNSGELGVPTGFRDLDDLLGGLQPGQVMIVAGRPGMGKTTMAVDALRHAAIRHNLPGVIFSLEMSKPELVMRILAAEARIPLNVLRGGKLSDDDWTKLARRMGEISEAPLFVDDSPLLNLMEIRAKARRLKQRHDLKLIVVDYLQLMNTPGRSESREREVSDLSRGLKLLAKELELPVIVVSQLNRGPEQRTDKRPQLSDLRESGSLEQDADIVLLLHREEVYDRETSRVGEADFIVAKHRNGPTGTITVAAQLHLSRFVDMVPG